MKWYYIFSLGRQRKPYYCAHISTHTHTCIYISQGICRKYCIHRDTNWAYLLTLYMRVWGCSLETFRQQHSWKQTARQPDKETCKASGKKSFLLLMKIYRDHRNRTWASRASKQRWRDGKVSLVNLFITSLTQWLIAILKLMMILNISFRNMGSAIYFITYWHVKIKIKFMICTKSDTIINYGILLTSLIHDTPTPHHINLSVRIMCKYSPQRNSSVAWYSVKMQCWEL